MLTSQETHSLTAVSNLIWHKDVSTLKVSIFALRLLCNRLPTKDNLVRRGILPNDSQLCEWVGKQLNTCFYLAIYLVLFGTLFVIG